jgi:hypothetical protein
MSQHDLSPTGSEEPSGSNAKVTNANAMITTSSNVTTSSSVLRVAQITLPSSAHLNPNEKGSTGSGSWSTWRRTLLGTLEDDQRDILDGTRPRPNRDSPLFDAWQQDNTAVRRAILGSTVDAIHVVDDSIRDSKAIFDALQTHYAPNDTETNFRTLQAFFNLRLNSSTRDAFLTWETEYRRLAREITEKNIKLEDLITMKAMTNLPDDMQDLRTATLVRNIDSAALPSREKCIDVIKSYIWSKDNKSSSAAYVAVSKQSRTRTRHTEQSRSRPAAKLRCYACGSSKHGVMECTDSAKKSAYDKAIRAFRESHVPVSAIASADPFELWVASDDTLPANILIDTGASHHMTGTASHLVNYVAQKSSPLHGVGQGALVVGKGNLPIRLANGTNVLLHGVLHIDTIPFTIISPGRLFAERKITAKFGAHARLEKDGRIIATGQRMHNNLYTLDASIVTGKPQSPLALAASTDELTLWHRRYAHLSVDGLKTLAKSGLVPALMPVLSNSPVNLQCDSCAIGKAKSSPFAVCMSERL